MSRLLSQAYTVHQMSYDLGRLRLNGLINRVKGTNRYTLTSDGLRVAISYTKLYQRLLLAADTPQPRTRYVRHWPPSTNTSRTTLSNARLRDTA
jgi:predicted MarR family transcription regulator